MSVKHRDDCGFCKPTEWLYVSRQLDERELAYVDAVMGFKPMDEWELAFGELLDREDTIHKAKRHDYTGGGDPLHNYRKSAELIGVSLEKLVLSRMMEKLIRLSTLLDQDAAVKDESFEDTALDIAIQAKLLILARRKRWSYQITTE